MKIAAITDIGSCRQENQDNYCAQQLAGGTAWGIVCDGMGGVNGGRIAARIATDTMQQYFARHMRSLEPGAEKAVIMRGFDLTNRAVYEKSTSDPEMQGMGAHVNLIPINPVDGSPYSATDDANVHRFQKELEALGVNATVRRRLGTDISAACGQLRREDAQGK